MQQRIGLTPPRVQRSLEADVDVQSNAQLLCLNDPVATIKGCVYERSQIEEWIRRKRQQRAAVTPLGTGLELYSAARMPSMLHIYHHLIHHRRHVERQPLGPRCM